MMYPVGWLVPRFFHIIHNKIHLTRPFVARECDGTGPVALWSLLVATVCISFSTFSRLVATRREAPFGLPPTACKEVKGKWNPKGAVSRHPPFRLFSGPRFLTLTSSLGGMEWRGMT